MAKQLRSDVQGPPKDLQFTHFGVLNSGGQSKGSLVTSITINVVLAIIAIIIGAAARVTVEKNKKIAELVVPLNQKPPEPPPPPKVIKLPKPPELKPVEPKIKLPDVKIEPPKPVTVPMARMEKPLPVVVPAPPKVVAAAAAPKPVTVNLGHSASVVNDSPHPAPVALGRADNPIAPSNRPATAAVNLGQRGLPGMQASNMGGGPPSRTVNLGSGQPNGSLAGGGPRAVQGVRLGGVTNGTGTAGNGVGSRPPAQVQLGQAIPPPGIRQAVPTAGPARSAPQVTFKPRPVYTAEATALHLEGVVSVKIRVSASGSVQIIGVTNGLGHGLDQSAERAVLGMHFKPAMDAQGNPVDWEGVVNITFQMAG